MRKGLGGRLTLLLAAISVSLVIAGAKAQDRDSYIARAKAFGLDIGYASFCGLDGEKVTTFADAGMADNLPTFDDEEFNAIILVEFEAAMRGAAETGPADGCEAHLKKIAPRIP